LFLNIRDTTKVKKTVIFELTRTRRSLMEDLTISKGWFRDKDDESTEVKKKFCEHRANTVTLDYEVGIEYCSFCGALAHYNPDLDALEWTLPEYLQKQNYN
jgi:hypothetical protein